MTRLSLYLMYALPIHPMGCPYVSIFIPLDHLSPPVFQLAFFLTVYQRRCLGVGHFYVTTTPLSGSFLDYHNQDQKGLRVFWCVAVSQEEMDGVSVVSNYHHRWPVQEDVFKKMDEIDALNINYGRKVVEGENRNRKRHQEEVAGQLEKKEQRLKAKEEDLTQAQQKLSGTSVTKQPKWYEARQKKIGAVT